MYLRIYETKLPNMHAIWYTPYYFFSWNKRENDSKQMISNWILDFDKSRIVYSTHHFQTGWDKYLSVSHLGHR